MGPDKHDVHIPVKTKLFVYISHCFTTMGARMWWFGIGLFLVEVTPHSLQLTALYGFSNGGAMLLLAAVIGDWIDRSNRLRAARVALVLNNVSIAVCCVVIFFVLTYRPEIEAVWEDARLLTLCFAVVVIITIVANLTNLGRVLIMERDWIVEICQRDKATIATMSATFRFIDLCTKVVAPLVTGHVMTYGSHIYGAIFIGIWNIVALVAEYYLVWKVYTLVPALHTKSSADKSEVKEEIQIIKSAEHADKEYQALPSDDVPPFNQETVGNTTPHVEIYDITATTTATETEEGPTVHDVTDQNDTQLTDKHDTTIKDVDDNSSTLDQEPDHNISPKHETNESNSSSNNYTVEIGTNSKGSANGISRSSDQQLSKKDLESVEKATANTEATSRTHVEVVKETPNSLTAQLCYSMVSLYRGWKTFMKYDVAVAGWALAFLYFTVLGFDNITIGYATTQGMSESLVGILIGCAAVFGIIASISFPILRRKFGLVRTGTIGFSWEVCCLCLCIVSLWMPGGTFDPNRDWSKHNIIKGNCSNTIATTIGPLASSSEPYVNTTYEPAPEPELHVSTACNHILDVSDDIPESKASIIMLLMGIVGARFGVWLTDLAITQLFLEAVAETERGIVNGFQSSLNKLMDMFKFIMIIFIPDPSMFGYPAIVSFCFIFSAWLIYTRFSKKRTGHLLCGNNYNYSLDDK
ncbi:solute carrier family 40 member 1-like [Mizuhopecten yessoensis]|nr:solute carrier family 40 member 1-like [Mizuhopecten yessoensis]